MPDQSHTHLIEPRFRGLFLTLFCVFALFGTSMTIIGATLPKILADFQWSYLAAGTVMGSSMVTYFVSTYLAGHLIRRWGAKITLSGGLILATLGLAFFAARGDALFNTLLGGLIGLGQGAIELCVNWLTLRIDRAKSGRPMNLMHGAFAVGAIVGPLAVGMLMQTGLAWTTVYRGIAVLFGGFALLALTLHLPEESSPENGDDATSNSPVAAAKPLAAHPAYWLAFAALFFYVGVELGVSNWVAEYFVRVFEQSTAASALLVSLFWAGLLAGRFGVPLLYRGHQDALLLPLAVLATVAIAVLTLFGYLHTAWGLSLDIATQFGRLLIVLAGLGCSIYYPAIISLLGEFFPHDQSRAIGFAASGGGIGAFLFPFAMSAMADQWGIRAGFGAYAAFALVMSIAAMGMASMIRRHRRHAH